MDCGKKSVAVETSNLQSIVTNAQQLKQVQGEYNFTSGTTMTGRLIQIGGTTKGMTVQGTTSSSTAMLWNSYGGQVVIAPVAVGFNNGFSVTSHKAPQADCIAITINSTAYNDGVVSTELAGKAYSSDTGMTGNNTLVFIHNS